MQMNAIKILIFLPLIYTLIFGGLFYKNSITGVPIIVENLDDGTQGQKILRSLTETPEISVIEVAGDSADIDKKIFSSDATGAVVIPKDFSQKILRGENVSIEVIVDNTNTVLGGVVTRAAQSVISTANAEILARQRIAAGWNSYQAGTAFLTISNRIFYNPTSGYTDFFLSVLILHSVQIAIVFAIASVIVEEKFQMTPQKFFAKFLTYWAISISTAAACLAVGIKFFHMICRGDFWEILAVIAAFNFCMVSFAMCVGAWNKISYRPLFYTLAYIMPSILFTGAIWTRYSMDNFSLFLSYVMPIGYAADDLRNLLLKGSAFGWQIDSLILIFGGGIFLTLGVIGMNFGGRENVSDNAQGIYFDF